MQLGIVLGSATATVKHPSLAGRKLLAVQLVLADGSSPDGDPLLAIDPLGAARGQTVMLTNEGTVARELIGDPRTPARWTVIGIRD